MLLVDFPMSEDFFSNRFFFKLFNGLHFALTLFDSDQNLTGINVFLVRLRNKTYVKHVFQM